MTPEQIKFTIRYDDMQNLFVMNGYAERWVGGHLERLAKVFGVTDALTASSESHQLAILQHFGVDVEIEDNE